MKKIFYFIIILTLSYIIYECCIKNREDFVPFNVLTNNEDLVDLNNLIKKIIPIFHKNKFNYWSCGGTSIGIIREKGLIPWDDDADFCIMENDIDNLFKMEEELDKLDLGIVQWFGGYKIHDKNGKKIEGKNFNYPFIDLFVMVKKNDKIILKNDFARKLWPNEYYFENEIYPLKLYNFEDYQVYGPNKIVNYLDRNYNGWREKALKTYDHVVHQKFDKTEFPIDYNLDKKPFLWQYWDGPMSSFIKLSMKSVDKHCSESFQIVRLNKDNIYNYLPEMKEYEDKMKNLLIAQKVDIYRIMLLYKYGGIYLDADTIVLRDPIEIINKLKKYDFVGFGCTPEKCIYGYGKPSNWILASRPTSILMAKILRNQLEQLDNKNSFDYHDLGKLVIWKELDNLINNHKYEYFHYPNKVDGSRDRNGNWITTEMAFSNKKLDYEDESNMMFFVYYNSHLDEETKKISEDDLMSKNWNITKFLKRGLGLYPVL